MKLLSAKGEKSTWFERVLFGGALVGTALVIAPGISETVQVNQLLGQADPALQARCQEASNYSALRFWNSNVQAYSTCIVEAKDPAVQNAAGKYLLKGKEGEFTVAPGPEASDSSTLQR